MEKIASFTIDHLKLLPGFMFQEKIRLANRLLQLLILE